LFALAERLLRAAGAQVEQPAGPEGLRATALSWLAEHDTFLRSVDDTAGAWPDSGFASTGRGVLLSDDAALVAQHPPLTLPIPATRALWATDAATLLAPPPEPAAALTLTEAEAQALRATGVDALALLRWPTTEVPARPARVVICVGVDLMYLLDDVLAALRRALPGTPRPDLLPDAPIRTATVTHAPVHTAVRTRLLARADLVLALGEAVGADLAAFEAAGHGAAVLRVLPGQPAAPAALGSGMPFPDATALPALAAALPPGYRLAVPDHPAVRTVGTVPPPALTDWLRRVLEPARSPDPVPTPS
jgi:hypothetical protein